MFKIKQLILSQNNPNNTLSTLNCLKIDSVYKKALLLQAAFQKDTSGVIKKKLECFRKSIFLPFSS